MTTEPETATAPSAEAYDMDLEGLRNQHIVMIDDDTAAILVAAASTASAGEIAVRLSQALSNLPWTRDKPVAVVPVPQGKLSLVPEQAFREVGYIPKADHDRLMDEAIADRTPACPITGQDLEGLNAFELEVETADGDRHTIRTALEVVGIHADG